MMNPEFDVADAFKRPDRSAGLAGRLGTRRPTPRPERPQEPADAPPQPDRGQDTATPAQAPQEPITAPREPVRRRPSPRKAGEGSDGRLVVALPVALRDRARAQASSRGETYLDVTLAAVQDTHPRLAELIAAAHTAPDEAPAGGLFEHRPRRRKVAEATVQVTIRGLSAHDRGVLEDLVDQTGAANLTELLTVALDEYLPQRPRALR